jgi:DNA-binding transcriptional ArsR family regulator
MSDKNETELCENYCVHPEKLELVEGRMPPENELADMAELFKVFGDSTRIKILYILSESELCVCDIAELLGMTQPAISYQLKVLKQAKLVRSRREG